MNVEIDKPKVEKEESGKTFTPFATMKLQEIKNLAERKKVAAMSRNERRLYFKRAKIPKFSELTK